MAGSWCSLQNSKCSYMNCGLMRLNMVFQKSLLLFLSSQNWRNILDLKKVKNVCYNFWFLIFQLDFDMCKWHGSVCWQPVVSNFSGLKVCCQPVVSRPRLLFILCIIERQDEYIRVYTVCYDKTTFQTIECSNFILPITLLDQWNFWYTCSYILCQDGPLCILMGHRLYPPPQKKKGCISFTAHRFCRSKQCRPWWNAALCGISLKYPF